MGNQLGLQKIPLLLLLISSLQDDTEISEGAGEECDLRPRLELPHALGTPGQWSASGPLMDPSGQGLELPLAPEGSEAHTAQSR